VKLIICNSLPTSRLFGEKVDANWYADAGMDVEFWDLAPIFIPVEQLLLFYSGALGYRYQGPRHRSIESRRELDAAISSNRHALFWHLSRFDRMHDDDDLIDLFNRYGVRYVFQHFDPQAHDASPRRLIRAAAREISQCWYARICRPVAVVTSGSLGREQVQRRYPLAKVISVPSVKVWWPYSVSAQPSNYVVFVDESYAFDPDSKLHGHQLCSDVYGYYRRMRDLFSVVEDCLGIPVIIACSGKYIYSDAKASFGNRDVIYGHTLALLHGCSIALGHLSLALDQTIVSRKPVLLVDDLSFTAWRRRGFESVVTRFRQQHRRSDKLDCSDIREALTRALNFYEAVEFKYFREPDVSGDYRQLCKDAFEKIL
jgi:hypothetical protein